MSGLLERIKGVKVEWVSLGDKNIFDVASGGTPSKSKKEYWENGDIPWIKSESCENKPIYSANHYITNLGLQKSSAKLLEKNTTLIALVGATIFKTAFLEFSATTNQNIASIKSKKTNIIDDKFIFYYITNQYEKLKNEMRNYGMLNLTTLRKFKIPIPPLEIQKEIVQILDTFTELTTELKNELTLRQKQYRYYRDKLLTFDGREEDLGFRVEWKSLGDKDYIIIENHKRKPVKASLRISGNIPYYGANNIQDYVDGYTHEGEYVLIAEDGSKSLENYSIQYANGKFWANNHIHVIRGTSKVNTKYLYYLLQTLDFIPYLSGGDRAKLTKSKLIEIKIPIPPLEKQREIVSILDKFDTLVNSISEGLPREIELRQKQYEYYRDMLLNFDRG